MGGRWNEMGMDSACYTCRVGEVLLNLFAAMSALRPRGVNA